MSADDASVKDLYEIIKLKFEETGVLDNARGMLQTKMVALIEGEEAGDTSAKAATNAAKDEHEQKLHDKRLNLLNQLILEYFYWHGFNYTSEMFCMESGTENVKPNRDHLEAVLGKFDHKKLPILLEIVAELMEKKN